MVIDVAANGYIVNVWEDGSTLGNGGMPTDTYVATSMAQLLRAIKEISVEARLCGNKSGT